MLAVQRDHYVPLKVIREHLSQIDRGRPPPAPSLPAGRPPSPVGSGAESRSARPATGQAQPPAPPAAARQPLRLSAQDLLEASGLTETALSELERNQIVLPAAGHRHYGRDALTLAIAARRLGEYGIDGRHLRAFKMSADREVGLVEQAIAPHLRRAGGTRDVSGRGAPSW